MLPAGVPSGVQLPLSPPVISEITPVDERRYLCSRCGTVLKKKKKWQHWRNHGYVHYANDWAQVLGRHFCVAYYDRSNNLWTAACDWCRLRDEQLRVPQPRGPQEQASDPRPTAGTGESTQDASQKEDAPTAPSSSTGRVDSGVVILDVAVVRVLMDGLSQ